VADDRHAAFLVQAVQRRRIDSARRVRAASGLGSSELVVAGAGHQRGTADDERVDGGPTRIDSTMVGAPWTASPGKQNWPSGCSPTASELDAERDRAVV